MEAAFLTSLKVAIYRFYSWKSKISKRGDVKKGGNRIPLPILLVVCDIFLLLFCTSLQQTTGIVDVFIRCWCSLTLFIELRWLCKRCSMVKVNYDVTHMGYIIRNCVWTIFSKNFVFFILRPAAFYCTSMIDISVEIQIPKLFL